MDKEESVNISEFCRLCLKEPGIFNIFKSQGLFQDVYEFTGVKVFLSDNLPQMVCRQCVMVIDNIKKLKAIAIKNDKHIRTLATRTFEPCNEVQTEKFIIVKDSNSSYSDPSRDKTSSFDSYETYYVKTEDITTEEHNGTCLQNDISPSQTEPSLDLQHNKWDLEQKPCIENLKPNNLTYRCQICEKKFDTWKKFYLHNRLHNKSIACTFKGCQKKFSTKGDLTKHLRVHTGERPYECDHCLRRFKQRVSLKTHKEVQHNKSENEVIIGT